MYYQNTAHVCINVIASHTNSLPATLLTFIRAFQEQACATTNQLAVATILLENIIFHVGEDYLLNHIELCMAASIVDNRRDGSPVTDANTIHPLQPSAYFASNIHNAITISLERINNIGHNELASGCDADLQLFMSVLKLFFTSLLQFHQFSITAERFKRHHLNANLIDKAMTLPKQITDMATVSAVLVMAEAESRNVVRIFAKFLLSIDCSGEIWLQAIERVAEGFDRKMLTELLADVCNKYVSLMCFPLYYYSCFIFLFFFFD